jgi:hypothetical protein
MNIVKILFMIFLFISFMVGLHFYTTFYMHSPSEKEGLSNNSNRDVGRPEGENKTCFDLLVNNGENILLYNTNMPEMLGVNPLSFNNLDEYIKYLDNQRKDGLNCPILYLQKEVNTQGNDVYRIRPDPFNNNSGGISQNSILVNQNNIKIAPLINSNDDNAPYNQNMYNGFDPYNLQVGIYTDLDKIHDSTQYVKYSDNPMDSNWGGVIYTEEAIRSGKYGENNVKMLV